jgi:hypothetical protein
MARRRITDTAEMLDVMLVKLAEYEADAAAGGRRYDRVLVKAYPRWRPTGVILLGVDHDVPLISLGDNLVAPALFHIEMGEAIIGVNLTAEHPLGEMMLRNGHRLLVEAVGHLVVTVVERPTYLQPDEEFLDALRARNAELLLEGQQPMEFRTSWRAGEHPSDEPDVIEAIDRRFRSQIIPVDVEQAAAAYLCGGVEAITEALHVSERQAYRYLRLARQRGLLPPRRGHG